MNESGYFLPGKVKSDKDVNQAARTSSQSQQRSNQVKVETPERVEDGCAKV